MYINSILCNLFIFLLHILAFLLHINPSSINIKNKNVIFKILFGVYEHPKG